MTSAISAAPKPQTDTSNTSQGGDWAWQKAKGKGASDQTTNYNQFNVGTLAMPVNSVQIGLGARDSVSALAQQPGMAWVNQIANDPKLAGKVDWTKVEEAHSQWDYKQQGLTPAAAAVITLVVAYFTAGAASGLGVAAGESAAVAAGEGVALAGGGAFVSAGTGAAISSVVGGAVTAGVSALAWKAVVAIVNGHLRHRRGNAQPRHEPERRHGLGHGQRRHHRGAREDQGGQRRAGARGRCARPARGARCAQRQQQRARPCCAA